MSTAEPEIDLLALFAEAQAELADPNAWSRRFVRSASRSFFLHNRTPTH